MTKDLWKEYLFIVQKKNRKYKKYKKIKSSVILPLRDNHWEHFEIF